MFADRVRLRYRLCPHRSVNIRLGDDLLAKVDAWRASGPITVSRASAIRSMVAAALGELDDDTIGGY